RRSSLLSTLFPYTTLFRSAGAVTAAGQVPGFHGGGCGPKHAGPAGAAEFPHGQRGAGRIRHRVGKGKVRVNQELPVVGVIDEELDRKSTRLNSSHVSILYA